MNGNFTLIPAFAARRLGNLDGAFRHQLGDFDYGLRAMKAGIPIIIAPGYFGYCSDNSCHDTWRDSTRPLAKRWKHLCRQKARLPVNGFFIHADILGGVGQFTWYRRI